MNQPYRERETSAEDIIETPTTLQRWWAIYKARKAMANKEERKWRMSTKLWVSSALTGTFAIVFWNGYMFWNIDSSHDRIANIVSWNFVLLTSIAATLSVFFLIAGFHMRWERRD